MNVFEKQYNTYRIVSSIVGLWPYHDSIYTTIHRMTVGGFFLSCIITQIPSILNSEITVQRCLFVLSTSSTILLFFIRYVSFVCCFPLIKIFFDLIQTEEDTLEDSNEVQLLVKHFENSSRIISIYLCVCFAGTMISTTYVLIPPILDLTMPLNESRTRYVSYITEVLSERTVYLDAIFLKFVFCYTIGLFCVLSTESAVCIWAHYVCGLFKITSYRLQNAIADAANQSSLSKRIGSNYSNFHRAVDIHLRAIELCSVLNTLFVCDYRRLTENSSILQRYINIGATNMLIHYLVASLLVVISFALCLNRLCITMMAMNDTREILICITFVTIHVLFMYLNNYCGQLVLDSSIDVFNQLCNSRWYCIPLRSQKLLLVITLRSSIECVINLSGLFVPCYRGFASMMSTSFSYFTLMYTLR